MTSFSVKLQILPFSNAFYRGLTDLISPSWLKLFNASEFNQVYIDALVYGCALFTLYSIDFAPYCYLNYSNACDSLNYKEVFGPPTS